MLKEIRELAEKMGSLEEIKKELKRVQSVKCRLKKQKAREDYEIEMEKVVSYEQALKEAREYYEPKKPTVTTMTWDQIKELDYEQTMKAIKSIQSKKCNSQYLTKDINENVEYQQAVQIEQMLLEHKKQVKPVEETVVRKSEIDNIIGHIENQQEELSKEYVLELLKKLKEQES